MNDSNNITKESDKIAPQGNYITVEEFKITFKEFKEDLLQSVETAVNTRIQVTVNRYIETKIEPFIVDRMKEVTDRK